jgi:hypothetical protein
LRRIYKIIYNEFYGTKTNTKISFQIAVKAINNLVGPNSIIFILLVFGTYPRITNSLVLSLTITKKN